MTNICTQELFELKEKGWSDGDIADFFTKQGRPINVKTVSQRLYRYYKSKGKKKPLGRKKSNATDILIEELVELKEQRLSDREIVEHFKSKGMKISITWVNKRLTEYYVSIGQEKPRARLYIDIEEIVRLKREGLSNREISKKLADKGIDVSEQTINERLREYYSSKGQSSPRVITNINNSKNIHIVQIGKTGVEYDNPVKQILMNGITIDEYISESGNEAERQCLEIKLRKLEFLAWYSEINNRTMDGGL